MVKKKLNATSPLTAGGESPRPPLDMEKVDSDLYGALGNVSKRVSARLLDLDEIRRDPTQPRRVVPMRVVGDWRGEPDGVIDVIHRWHDAAQDALVMIDVKAHIDKRAMFGEDTVIPPLVKDFLAVVKLAGDIKRDGLINPITVIRINGGYQIETGERRWWAYQFLRVFDNPDKWASIPAFVSDSAQSVWRTAGENASREELNAIAKARQFALLVMEINKGRDGIKYDGYDFFDHDREFYAQVANGAIHPVPEQKVKAVCDAIGINGGKARLSQIRRLLRELTNEQWDKFDEDSTPERVIREILSPSPEPERLTMVNLSSPSGESKPSPFQQFAPKIGLQNEPYGGQSATPPQTPQPPTKPSPLQYRPAPVPLDEEDIVMMDDEGDGESIINHPFNDGFGVDMRPSDLEVEIPKDTRYVDTNSELATFIGAMVRRGMNRNEDVSDWEVMRDFDRSSLIKKMCDFAPDEVTQMVTNWRDMLYGVLNAIDAQMVAVLDAIWEDVQNGG